MKDLRPRDAIHLPVGRRNVGQGWQIEIVRQVAGFFLENGRIMSKKLAEVKGKESYSERAGRREERAAVELITFGLGEDVVRQTAAKEETRAGIESGKSGKTFACSVEIASAFEAKISAVGILHQNVIAEFARYGIRGVHNRYSPIV
jgi:hypothetical protein